MLYHMNSEAFCCFERVTSADNGFALEVGDNAVDNLSLVKGNRVRINPGQMLGTRVSVPYHKCKEQCKWFRSKNIHKIPTILQRTSLRNMSRSATVEPSLMSSQRYADQRVHH